MDVHDGENAPLSTIINHSQLSLHFAKNYLHVLSATGRPGCVGGLDPLETIQMAISNSKLSQIIRG